MLTENRAARDAVSDGQAPFSMRNLARLSVSGKGQLEEIKYTAIL
jgi:hypothetical protein